MFKRKSKIKGLKLKIISVTGIKAYDYAFPFNPRQVLLLNQALTDPSQFLYFWIFMILSIFLLIIVG